MKVIAPELDTQKSKESIRRGGVDDESTASLRNSAQLIEQARHGGERDVFRDSNCEHRVETSVIEGQRQCRSDDTARDIAELNTPEEPSPSYVQANCRGAQSGKAPKLDPTSSVAPRIQAWMCDSWARLNGFSAIDSKSLKSGSRRFPELSAAASISLDC